MVAPRIATAKAPGKLFLAGEYSVVNSKQTAILTTVNAFLTVTCRHSKDDMGILTTNQSKHPFQWMREQNRVFSTTPRAETFSLIWQTLDVVMKYCEASGISHETVNQYFNIDIVSELDHPSGEKYGLGSSAAVTVALIDALLQFFDYNAVTGRTRQLLIYKLAVISQSILKLKGSFGDIAAASFTGMLFYQNFDRSWLDKQPTLTKENIKLLADTHWPSLIIQPLYPSKDWTISVVWSKTASSTEELLTALPSIDDSFKNIFLRQSKNQVSVIKEAAELNNFNLFTQGIEENYITLKDYTSALNRPYLTPTFEAAEKIAHDNRQTFKISGSGAGDCAYVISPNAGEALTLRENWRNHGLTVLDLEMWSAAPTKEENNE